MQNRAERTGKLGRVPVRDDRVVGFAGSRRGSVEVPLSQLLIGTVSELGFHILVGCANGIDRCFRESVAASALAGKCTVHCAFPSGIREAEALGLKGVCCVASISSATAALHWRTVLMVRECSLLVLFPDDPKTGTWGKGSRLAFNTAIQDHIPVFMVTTIPPHGTKQIQVKAGSLFGVIDGLWVVPQGVEVPDDQSA